VLGRRRALLRAATLVLLLAGCAGDEAAPSSDGQPAGFERTAARITAADGEVCELCLWLADSPERRGQGLIGVTDLGPADGMVFRFGAPSQSAFHMRGAPMPLSIAFFAEGAYVGAQDMTPCMDAPEDACPVYATSGAFTDAVEVPLGELDDHGIGPGSRLEMLAAPCPDGSSDVSSDVSAHEPPSS